MNFKNAQSSVELVVITAISLVILLILLQFADSQISSSELEKQIMLADDSAEKIKNAINEVYFEGEGARRQIFIRIPEGTEEGSALVEGSMVKISVLGNDRVAFADANASGIIPDSPGGYWIKVESRNGAVFLGETMLGISRSAIYESMMENDSRTEQVQITNNYQGDMNVNIAKDWNNTAVSFLVSEASFILPQGQTKEITLSFGSSTNSGGNYVGVLEIYAGYDSTNESATLPVNAEVFVSENNAISAIPGSWQVSIHAGENSTKSFIICNTSASDLSDISFTPSVNDAGDFVLPTNNILLLDKESCADKNLEISVPSDASEGSRYGTIVVSDGIDNQTILVRVIVLPSPDITAPAIALLAPAGGYTDTDGNVQFDYNVNDPESTINSCSLVINGAVDQTDSTITEGVVQSFTKTAMANGSYTWDVNCVNSAALAGGSAQDRALTVSIPDITAPAIALLAPAGGYTDTDGNVQFDYNVNDPESTINSCSLVINGAVDQTDSTITEGVVQSFTKTAMANGSYTWDVNCVNSAALAGGSAQDRALTVSIPDITAPAIALLAPAGGYTDTDGNVQFDYNVNDPESTINSCSLVINGAVDQTDSTITEGVVQSFTKTAMANGSYTWDVNCVNSAALAGGSAQDRALSILKAPQTIILWAGTGVGGSNSGAITGAANNVASNTNNGSMYGRTFNGALITGTITNVKIVWSHSIPATLSNDSVGLKYGISALTTTKKTYTITSTPIDKQGTLQADWEIIDVTSDRAWSVSDISNLWIGGTYVKVNSSDSRWNLDAVGAMVTFTPQ